MTCFRLLILALLPAISAVPAPLAPVVPDGYTVEPYLYVPGPASLRRDLDGKLLVGALNVVLKEEAAGQWATVATGSFLATAIDRAADGSLYIGDTFWVAQGEANLWVLPPGEATLQVAVAKLRYCQGVLTLPDGDLLAVDAGFLGPDEVRDGRILRIPAGTREGEANDFPHVIQTPLRNPLSIEYGPDGKIYFLDRGNLDTEPGTLYRFSLGEAEAEVVLTGLNDPFDFAWTPDGSILLTDTLNGNGSILRYVPSTGVLETWASGFPAPHGIDVAPNGNVFVADITGTLYRISPTTVSVAVQMDLEPETLNRRSQGNFVLVRVASGPGPVTQVRLTAVDGAPITPIPALRVMMKPDGFHAQFDRLQLHAVLPPGTRVVRLEGAWEAGGLFTAEDSVRVLD